MLVYIAAPLGDPNPAVRAWHRERANLLSALAFACDAVPVCVHTYAELAIGADSDADARERGLKMALLAVEMVFRAAGHMWVLLGDDGRASPGTTLEIAKWDALRTEFRLKEHSPDSDSWANWRACVVHNAPHLLPEFDRLAVRPIGQAQADAPA